MSDFKIGDVVEWTSQSAGSVATKIGTVEGVVWAGQRPERTSRNPSPGAPRDHASYLVRVKGRGLYWPRVAHLRMFRPASPGDGEGRP